MKRKSQPIEIIKGTQWLNAERLYWVSDSEPPKNVSRSFYFNIDNVRPCPCRIWNTSPSTRTSAPSTSAKPGSMSPNWRSCSATPTTSPTKSTTTPPLTTPNAPTLPTSWAHTRSSSWAIRPKRPSSPSAKSSSSPSVMPAMANAAINAL